jgi:hypothetical protein
MFVSQKLHNTYDETWMLFLTGNLRGNEMKLDNENKLFKEIKSQVLIVTVLLCYVYRLWTKKVIPGVLNGVNFRERSRMQRFKQPSMLTLYVRFLFRMAWVPRNKTQVFDTTFLRHTGLIYRRLAVVPSSRKGLGRRCITIRTPSTLFHSVLHFITKWNVMCCADRNQSSLHLANSELLKIYFNVALTSWQRWFPELHVWRV